MTKRELAMRIEFLKYEALLLLKIFAPVDTGNLLRSIKMEELSYGSFRIYVDTAQAPYMQYTNEEWNRGIGRAGKLLVNPNLGWWDRAVEFVMNHIKTNLNGELRRA